MRRPWLLWVCFAACLTVGAVAMAWVSRDAMRIDRDARLEESVRLALWRMDSHIGLLVARESAVPYYAYDSFFRPPSLVPAATRPALTPALVSPLITPGSALVRLHFQVGPSGQLTCPQAPESRVVCELAVRSGFTTVVNIARSREALGRVSALLNHGELLALLPEPPPLSPGPLNAVAMAGGRNGDAPNSDLSNFSQTIQTINSEQDPQQQQQSKDQRRGQQEFNNREMNNRILSQNGSNNFRGFAGNVSEGSFKPMWFHNELILARRVRLYSGEIIQGCWLDWNDVQAELKADVQDLLPEARLERADPAAPDVNQAHMLASIPVRVAPGAVPAIDDASPIRTSLLVAWGSAVLAAMAIAALLRGVVALSNRRAGFVSAVTHELRTPLTSLRLYTEMLDDGMVADPVQRSEYLGTLRNEANRLSHLVENVLGYARLERRRSVGRVETLPVADLVGAMRRRLEEHAAQSGRPLEIDLPREAAERRIMADPVAVEQILFNLVDNACKHAAGAENPAIELSVRATARQVALTVRDHGPGLAGRQAKRLFRPFSKSVQEAAASAPGLGLGLALSRRLARSMNGELSLAENSSAGAAFSLSLQAV